MSDTHLIPPFNEPNNVLGTILQPIVCPIDTKALIYSKDGRDFAKPYL